MSCGVSLSSLRSHHFDESLSCGPARAAQSDGRNHFSDLLLRVRGGGEAFRLITERLTDCTEMENASLNRMPSLGR